MAHRKGEEFSQVESIGHSWDGITELDNPLPRWWLWTFWATIIWSIGYCIAYPAIPLVSDATRGVLDYSSRADLAAQTLSVDESRAGMIARIADTPLGAIIDDQALYQFAVSGGQSAFKVHCSQCHGSGAVGAPGYPNLNDDDWLWPGTLEGIATTIRNGVRDYDTEGTRYSEMPSFEQVLEEEQIRQAATFVRALAGLEHDPDDAAQGVGVFTENCAVCHTATGEGDREQGASRLNDAIWFYGSTQKEIIAQIRQPKHGIMPAWGARLGEATVKQLAVYVHSLGGGQ